MGGFFGGLTPSDLLYDKYLRLITFATKRAETPKKTAQQTRFCSILDNYKKEKNEAEKSKNQIKQNKALKNRDDNITALLSVPGNEGSFTD